MYMSLSVVHFSDIHIESKHDLIFERIDAIKSACVGVIPQNADVIIAVSGDIANSGKKNQYEDAKILFEQIVDYIKEQKKANVNIVFVPGNHDCDLSENSSVRKVLTDSVSPEVDDEFYDNVSNVQKDFREFAKEFGMDSKKIMTLKEFEVNGYGVLFVLLNSSWMSTMYEVPGKLIMPVGLFDDVNPDKYKIVFYMYHHPENWLNPDHKTDFINNVRKNADILLTGHEHLLDNYEKKGKSFNVICNQGKELQDRNSEKSAFTILNFCGVFQNLEQINFEWDGSIYKRENSATYQYHKNISSNQGVFYPNKKAVEKFNDIGISINHYAKDCVSLSDLYVWPDVNKINYHNEKNKTIRKNVAEQLKEEKLNILIGSNSCGKTSFARMIFMEEEHNEVCCLLLKGDDFTTSDESKIKDVVETAFVEQYSGEFLEEFRQLPNSKKVIIVDDFDKIKIIKDRRTSVLNYIYESFGRIIILMSSNVELTSILKSNVVTSQEELAYYEIMPLGNKKRKDLISKWYCLDESIQTDDELNKKIEEAQIQIDTFLGNGAGFVPAMPVFVIGALQNRDALKQTYDMSKYGFLYESLIINSLSKFSNDYNQSGAFNVDSNILSRLAFYMLTHKRTSFGEKELDIVLSVFREEALIDIFTLPFLERMQEAKIIYNDTSVGAYRFRYPYIYYYFSARYIASNIKDKDVGDIVEYMSGRLYNETYGNIIIFVCHFLNSKDVIDDVLLNAYSILEDYEPFDFHKKNPVFDKIKDAVEALIPKTIVSNEDVETNKESVLSKMDEAGINDGSEFKGEESINDEISDKEKDMMAISAAFKTIEVLGQILQNYPAEIKKDDKFRMIDEMHKLSMRSVQALVKTMMFLEEDLIEFISAKIVNEEKTVNSDEVVLEVRNFINMLISGMARGMIHQVSKALNSNFIMIAATDAFEHDDSISSKLILIDLKMNCLKKCNYDEVKMLKKSFEDSNERFASRILDSIVANYLNYNKCDVRLRAKLCNLCGFQEQQSLIEIRKRLEV